MLHVMKQMRDIVLYLLIIQMEQIQALRFQVQEVGKHVKGSKKRYTWEVSLKDKLHTIVLDFSFISGKVKITVDRKILLQNQLPANVSFQYPFTLDGFALNIIQQGETFQLRLNNKVFSHLYTQQKTNTQFKKYEEQVKDIKVNFTQSNPNNKKISLNIGAFGGANKKKKEASSQSQGWNAFAGGSFPNYFGDNSQEQKPQGVTVNKPNLFESEDSTAVQTNNGFSLIETDSKIQKPSQNLFDFSQQAVSVAKVSSNDDFGQMNDMFKSLNVTKPAATQIDFFAQQKTETPLTTPIVIPANNGNNLANLYAQNSNIGGFDFNAASPSNINNSNFGTGYGAEIKQSGVKTNNSFATTNFGGSNQGNSDLSGVFFAQPQKLSDSTGFAKKPTVEETLPSINLGTTFTVQPNTVSQPVSVSDPNLVNSLTDININDFNTMQKLFQTNSLGQNSQNSQNSQSFNFNSSSNQFQPNVSNVPSYSIQPQPQQTQSIQPNNEMSFNTIQNLFQTTNYNQIKNAENLSQIQAKSSIQSFQINQPIASNPLDLFGNNKPASYSTLSGGSSLSGFDMSNFGTMQVNSSAKSGQLNFNFSESKVVPKPQNATSGDLI